MLKKIAEFLVKLLLNLKKQTPTLHSSVVALGCKNVKQYVKNFVREYGLSEFIQLITATILLACCILLLLFFILLFNNYGG